jgi:hypothetical protein
MYACFQDGVQFDRVSDAALLGIDTANVNSGAVSSFNTVVM